MKWVFYLVVFIYMCYRAVYGSEESDTISVEPVTYGGDTFLKVGSRKTIKCRGTSKNQMLEWLDPSGNVIGRLPGSRIHVQEHFAHMVRGGRIPTLGLTISNALASDTGLYQCRSGNNVLDAELCVIEPSQFVDTPTEVIADLGRSITLTCQAKGAPEPRLQWIKDRVLITDDDSSSKYRVMTKYNSQGFEGLLTITSLRPEDSGVYTCQSVQENPILESCVTTQMLNVTLQVTYAPILENGNETQFVYGKNNQQVHLVCSARAYPAAEYKWFRDLGDSMFQYDQKQLQMSEGKNEAVLALTATASTFGQRYKCRASNDKGDAEKPFVLLKMEKPRKPNEVNYYSSTDSVIQLNVSWFEDILFPVAGFDVKYSNNVKRKHTNGLELKNAKLIHVDLNEDEQYSDAGGMLVTIPDLEEETEYWIRLRATNDAGESPWSDITSATTMAKQEITEPPELVSPSAPDNINATFFGIFFAGAILVVAVACMFAMRMV